MKLLCVTGGSGFLGGALVKRFAIAAWRVKSGVRRVDSHSPPEHSVEPFKCNLPDVLDADTLDGADVLIHCAYVTQYRDKREAERVNMEGTRRLLKEWRARSKGPFVFISSASAHEGALSYYGRTKYQLEQELDPSKDLVIRPGLILGKGGLFGRMAKTLGSALVVPLFGGGNQTVQTIALDELVSGIHVAIERGLTGRLVLADPTGMSMRELMHQTALLQDNKPFFIPFPIGLGMGMLKVTEGIGLRLPATTENLLGLKGMVRQESASDLQRLGMTLRPARESLEALFRR